MLKSLLSVLFAALLFGFHYIDGISISEFCYVAGLFAVLGHVFPIYYGFKGGKGVLSTATVALVLAPIPFAILFALFVAIVAISKYVSLGSVCVATLFPVIVNGYIKVFLGGMPNGILSLSTIILAILVVWCHRENLKRISDRTERKLSFKKKDVEVKKDDEDEA
jgi:glycerol-3-phosphate acyltransferase PlsY